VLLHVIRQKLLLLEYLIAVETGVNGAVKVNETVQPELLFHFESGGALGALEVLHIDLFVVVDCILVRVARRRACECPSAV
jgi:hypothetical protein